MTRIKLSIGESVELVSVVMLYGFVFRKVYPLQFLYAVNFAALTEDDRINWGCSIIGCPSYIELMEYRLQQSGLPVKPPFLPQSFLQVLERDDPGMILRLTKQIPESLKRKQILVLAGQKDILVPWTACANFISALQAQSPQNIEVKNYEGVGHIAYHPEMMKDFYNWFIKFL